MNRRSLLLGSAAAALAPALPVVGGLATSSTAIVDFVVGPGTVGTAISVRLRDCIALLRTGEIVDLEWFGHRIKFAVSCVVDDHIFGTVTESDL